MECCFSCSSISRIFYRGDLELGRKPVNPLQVELWHERESNESLSDEVVFLREENERLRKRLAKIFFVLNVGVKDLESNVNKEIASLKRLLVLVESNDEKKVGK